MPTGIILKSASHEESDEVREKNLQAVVEAAGYEVAPKEAPAEPKRDDFENDEEFEAAHVEWEDKQEETEEEQVTQLEEEEEEVVTTAAAKPPKKSRRERAIEKATAPLRAKIEELEAKIGSKKEETPKEVPRPKRAEFDSDEKYEDALLAWGVADAEKKAAIKSAETAENDRLKQIVINYATQIEEAKEIHEDWDEVFTALEKDDIKIGNAAQNMLFELENGAEVSYYLARHPTIARKLGTISPLSAVAEVVRLSEKLKTKTPAHSDAGEERIPQSKPKPKVPVPVRTVSTGGSSETPTFAEIAARPNYPGKAKDLRVAAAAGR